jgi:sporulation protein YtfJ
VEDNFNDAVRNIMLKFKELIETEVVIGEPMNVKEGTVVIPISKVSLGLALGGSDVTKKEKNPGYSLGSGAGVSLTPIGFLVVDENGVKLLEFGSSGRLQDLLAEIPGLCKNIAARFNSKKDGKGAKKDKEKKSENDA